MPPTAHAPLLLLDLDNDAIALVLSALKGDLLDTVAVCGASRRLRLIHSELHPFSFLILDHSPYTPVIRLDFTHAAGAEFALNVKVQQLCFGSPGRRERARHADLLHVATSVSNLFRHCCNSTDECSRAYTTAKQCTDEMETRGTAEATTRRARAALDALRALHLVLFGPQSNQHHGTQAWFGAWADEPIKANLELFERMLQLEMTNRPFVSVAEYRMNHKDCKRLGARVRGKSTQACRLKLDAVAHNVPLSVQLPPRNWMRRVFHCPKACFWTAAPGGCESTDPDSIGRWMCDQVTFKRADAQGVGAELVGVQFDFRGSLPVFLAAERLRALLR